MATRTLHTPPLQPSTGTICGEAYLAADVGTVLWGRLPCASDTPVLSIAPGTTVTIDTVSHEGLLEDQGKDPVGYFGGHGVPGDGVLHDAIAIAAGLSRDPERDGPHIVVGPILVEDAEAGEEAEAGARRGDRAEHHLQDARVRQVELGGEVLRVAEAGALEDEAEREADERADEEAGGEAERVVRVEREEVHRHSFFRKGATR